MKTGLLTAERLRDEFRASDEQIAKLALFLHHYKDKPLDGSLTQSCDALVWALSMWRWLVNRNIVSHNLSGGHLFAKPLCGVNLMTINVSECNLELTRLCRAKLFRTNLSGSNLVRACLCKADMVSANLLNTDLSHAVALDTAHLRGAKYNLQTKWPNGFDPLNSGAVLVTE